MKHQVDIKSVMIGFLSTALLVAAFSFKDGETGKEGRYQTSVGQQGVVILDTKTGEYIINTDLSNNGWRKGDFSSTHHGSKGNKDYLK